MLNTLRDFRPTGARFAARSPVRRKRMTRKTYFVACLVLFLAFVCEVRACDTRHFYNNSTVGFSFTILQDGSCSIGSYTGKVCIIPPGQIAELHYPNTSSTIAVISTDNGRTYSGHTFPVQGFGSCYIAHRGKTGNIKVNDRADGDVTTCGTPSYPCKTDTKK